MKFSLKIFFSTAILIASLAVIASANKKGGDLRYAHLQKAKSLDANVWTATNAAHIMRQIYDPLVWQPEPGKFIPGLATEWKIEKNGTEFTFQLRKDVKFHDGTPFDAKAMKFTLDRIADPATRSLQSSRLGPYEKTEILDSHKIKVYFKQPWHIFMSNLSEVALAPASPAAVDKMGEKYPLYPVGTGPFKVKEWPDDTTVILENNRAYDWAPSFLNHSGPAYLDTITYKFIEEKSTRLIAFENNEFDIMDGLPSEDYQRIKEDDDFVLKSFVVPGLPQVMNINVSQGPTKELAVRQAMLYAIDEDMMVNLIFFGASPAAKGPLSSGSWAYYDGVEDLYPYDPAKAREILEEAGWKDTNGDGIREKDGKNLIVRHVTKGDYKNRKPAEFYQAQLKEVGIDAVVEAMAYEATARRYADNAYEMARLGYALFDAHDTFYLPFHSSQVEGGGQFNRSRVIDPRIDDLISKGVAETDIEKRYEIYKELQMYVMEQALFLPSYEVTFSHVHYPYVKDLKVDLLGREYFYDVYLDKK